MKPSFGQAFKMEREMREIRQNDIAKLFGLSSAQMVSNVERGLCYFPPKSLKKICQKYNIQYRPLATLVMEEKMEKLKKEWMR